MLRSPAASGDSARLISAEQCDRRFSRQLLLPNRHAAAAQIVAGLADGVLAEMEDGRCQHGIGATFRHALVKMFQIADAA
jgi:hypothetical protein